MEKVREFRLRGRSRHPRLARWQG